MSDCAEVQEEAAGMHAYVLYYYDRATDRIEPVPVDGEGSSQVGIRLPEPMEVDSSIIVHGELCTIVDIIWDVNAMTLALLLEIREN